MPAKDANAIFKLVSGSARVIRHPRISSAVHLHQNIHSSTSQSATPLPVGVVGPPPSPPLPAASQYGERIERRRKQAELLRQAKDLRASQKNQQGKQSPLKKRFWKEVNVEETSDGYQISLDARPIRTPQKATLTIPLSKPHLANAIALEWDLLTSAQQALKTHYIPITSLASHADAMTRQDSTRLRDTVLQTVMRYLDTDTLLCWAPEQSVHDAMQTEMHEAREGRSLREIQRQTAQPILAYLTSRVWPGAELHPVLDETSIVPKKQPKMTKDIIRGWIAGLPAYELAALERGTLATKSLLVATRLLVEWSEEFRGLQDIGSTKRFGIEEAAEACSTEVSWQTGMWGEVEDTHDVDKEDLRRQLGSVVLLVSGNR